MANTTALTNTKVKDFDIADSNGQYKLIVEEENPFALFDSGGLTYEIMLFSRSYQDGKIEEESIEQTQNTLREQLGDENIVFTDPKNATDDANHFENWVKNHVGAPVKLVTKGDGNYYHLGEGRSGGSFLGDSRFLKNYEKVTGTYDPTEHRVRFFDSLTEKQKEAVETKDETRFSSIYKSNSGSFKSLNMEGVVTDVILTHLDNQDNSPQRFTRDEIRTEIIDTLASGTKVVENNKYLADQIESLPEDFAYMELLTIVGGSGAENVQGTKQHAISGFLSSIARISIRFHIQNPETGYVFQSTAINAGGNKGAIESNSLQFEIVTGDETMRDFASFMTKLAKLPTTDMSAQDILQVLVENGFYNKEEGRMLTDDAQSMLDATRAVMNGRVIDISSSLVTPRDGEKDIDKLGSKIRGLHANQSNDNIKTALVQPSEAPAPSQEADAVSDPFQSLKAETPEETPSQEATNDVQGNPFAEDAEEEPSANPFADDTDDVEEVPSSDEATDTSDEEEKDLLDNPFK